MIPSPILVTGAAGFVGANLVRALVAAGVEVHAVVRASTDVWRIEGIAHQVSLQRIDLSDRHAVSDVVRSIDPAAIVHLAKHRGNPDTLDYEEAYAGNLHATRHLLQASLRCTRLQRFVHSGSSLEYDLSRSPLQESVESTPLTVHGVTKLAASKLCQHFAVRHSLPAVVLRFFTVYGPWEDPTRLVPRAIVSALQGGPLSVTRPDLAHDWIHVDDVVDACLRALSTPGLEGEVLNVATGRQSTNDEIVRAIEQCTGRSIVRATAPFHDRAWDTNRWMADISKTTMMMKWTAATDLQTGLMQTCEWMREHVQYYAAVPQPEGRM